MNLTTLQHWAEVEYKTTGRVRKLLELPEDSYNDLYASCIEKGIRRAFNEPTLPAYEDTLTMHTPYGDVLIMKEKQQ